AASAVSIASLSQLARAETPLIPRDVLFGNPEKVQLRISPDGKFLSYIAPVDGVLNVFVAPADDISKAKPVTTDTKRGIHMHAWTYSSGILVFTQDQDGDENNQVFAVNVSSGETKNLVNNPAVQAQLSGTSPEFPDEILIGFNDEKPQFHDLYRVNLKTGERQLVMKNPGMIDGGFVGGFLPDDHFKVRLALTFRMDASAQMYKPGANDGQWEKLGEPIAGEDSLSTAPAGFDKSGDVLYMIDSRNRDTAGLFAVNLKDNTTSLIAENAKADVGGIVEDPVNHKIQAVNFEYDREEYQIIDPSIQGDFDYLATLGDGEFQVTSRTLDDKKWTVALIDDNGPVKYFLYDRAAKNAQFMFVNRTDLNDQPLVAMNPVIIKSRDGLDLVSYLTLPKEADPDGDGKANKAVPLVLNVHGGPWARDSWGFNPEHQWLANRGYAVLSVNYRGSTGFGKNFLNKANKEWAGKMHDDLLDSIQWAVDHGVTTKDKVAIYGGSYGGYATLVGLTFTPDVFACGVDIVGPSSLVTLMQNAPPYWQSFMPSLKQRVGDHETPEGKSFLDSRSPLTHVDAITKPLLIGQGANDPRVTQDQADMIVNKMNEKKIPVTYVLFPDEGHGFARPENSLSFYAVAEAFLSKHLGGRFEPVGDDFKGSSIQVPTDTADLPGLADALETVKPE
ncbi:MAG TPA: S9 family peptidase, partial [Tepidisphaeraceae bacterium]|nr:S9 family peptidase [Tepidisphaeraceae bacterium]